jgi:hypothetical protein
MPIANIENNEIGLSVRTKINSAFAKLVPAVAYVDVNNVGSEGLITAQDLDKLVNLSPASIGAATAAQGALADTAVQPAALGTAAAQNVAAFATAAQGALADTAVQPAALGTAAAAATTDFATAAQGALADTAVQPGSLGTAAYANFNDFAFADQGIKADTAVQPGALGTAAAAATTDFATAAQGALADTAVQPAALGTAAAQNVAAFATAAQGALADTAVQPAALGTAAAAAITDFATAAQGALADTAVQPADVATTINLAATALQPESTSSIDRTSFTVGAGLVNPIIGIAGDSIHNLMSRLDYTGSLLTWRTFLTGRRLGIQWSPLAYSSGGYVYAIGGKTTAQIYSEQLPQIIARPPDILFLNGGTNNAYTTIADLDQAATDLQNVAAGAIGAGVKEVFIYPILPKTTNQWSTVMGTTGLTVAQGHQYINMKMSAYAKNTAKVYYVNPDPFMTMNNNIYYTSKLGYLIDGTHVATLGAYAQRDLYQFPLFNRVRLVTNPSNSWNSQMMYGNVLGTSGSMWATGGSLEGVSGNSAIALDWNLTNNTGLTVVPSIVTVDGVKKQRLTISGTPTLNTGTVRFSITKLNSAYFTGANSTWDGEIQLDITNFTNLFTPSFVFSALGGTTYTVNGIGPSTGSTPQYNFAPANTTFTLYPYNTTTVSATSACTGFTLYIELNGLVGYEASGTIDISSAGIFKIT